MTESSGEILIPRENVNDDTATLISWTLSQEELSTLYVPAPARSTGTTSSSHLSQGAAWRLVRCCFGSGRRRGLRSLANRSLPMSRHC